MFKPLIIVSVLAAWISTDPVQADMAMERQFIWEEANTRMAAARSPDEFLKAADTYRQLVNRGVKNGPLFYNLGTALLKAGRHEEALAAFLRAERYMGSTWELRRNMRLAVESGKNDLSLGWYRPLLFWHYGLATSVRATLAAIAFFLFWIGLFLRKRTQHRWAALLMIPALLFFVIFGSSAVTSVHLEARADAVTQFIRTQTPDDATRLPAETEEGPLP